MVSET